MFLYSFCVKNHSPQEPEKGLSTSITDQEQGLLYQYSRVKHTKGGRGVWGGCEIVAVPPGQLKPARAGIWGREAG